MFVQPILHRSIPNSCRIFEYKASISNVASSVSSCILSGRLFKKSLVSRRLLFTHIYITGMLYRMARDMKSQI